jgi:hypothetical protein
MSEHIPPVFIRTEEEDIREKADAARSLSPRERWAVIKDLCSFGAKAVAQHRDPQRSLDQVEPIPEESEGVLARLRDRHRGRPAGG